MFVGNRGLLVCYVGSLGPRISARVRGLFLCRLKTQKHNSNK